MTSNDITMTSKINSDSNSDSIDRILRLAFLEGAITTHGLYEKTVLRRSEEARAEVALQGATLRKLLREIESTTLSSSAKSIGEFLRDRRIKQRISLSSIQRQLDIPGLAYRMLENDSISPINVPLKTWKRIKDLWKVTWADLEVMIRASHYLTIFRPSYKGTLLRYRRKTGWTYPPDAWLSAARELYLQAQLELPARDRQCIENFLSELRRPENGLSS